MLPEEAHDLRLGQVIVGEPNYTAPLSHLSILDSVEMGLLVRTVLCSPECVQIFPMGSARAPPVLMITPS